jgi:5-methylcytosine-specific restriction endonuclease McrA
LSDFQEANKEAITGFSSINQHPFDKVRQQFQFLRDDGVISFLNNRGTYTLRKPEILEGELTEESETILRIHEPNKREYVKETFARERGWVKQAKDKLGMYCLHPNCSNSFSKENGLPYIEVHHIIPLFDGGEDAVWNLVVICAHHHKMAHFADEETQKKLKALFLKIVEKRL